MAGGADLKEDAVLPLECHFTVVQPPGSVHEPERTNQLLRVKALKTVGSRCRRGG
jgi:hypothetical protein